MTTTQLSGFTVLIVDRSLLWGYDLGAHLLRLGAKVHTVSSFPSALTFARTKKIDVAVVEYSPDPATANLCKALTEFGINYVFTSPPLLDAEELAAACLADKSMRKHPSPGGKSYGRVPA